MLKNPYDGKMKFSKGNTSISFVYDDDAMIRALKDGDDVVVVKVIVHQDKKVIACYWNDWDHGFSNLAFATFMKKFLEIPEYRLTLEHEGEWNDTVAFTEADGVNKQCKKIIDRLNKARTPKFADFAALKTFGRDSFSKMKLPELVSLLKDTDVQTLKNCFLDTSDLQTALRWVARGLSAHLAIRKVKTDNEIRDNARQSKPL